MPERPEPKAKAGVIKVGAKLIGWATDAKLREKGASGGLVTALLAAALKKGLVDKVLTLKKISEFEAVPVLTSEVEEVLQSGGSMHSVPVNLARYLPEGIGEQRIALPAKPCDARAVIERAKRNAVDLEKTFLIGLNCGGSIHPETTRKMLKTVYRLDPEEISGEEIVKGKLIFFTKDGKEHAISIDELEEKGLGRRENCRYCSVKIPINADLACGNWGVTGAFAGQGTFVEVRTEKGAKLLRNALEAGFAKVEPAEEKGIRVREKINRIMLKLSEKNRQEIFSPIEAKQGPERLKYFQKALENCIHCGACKAVCPVCTCGEDSKCTSYTSREDSYKISLFHLVRFLHLSDSCLGCGQCEDVCPAEIPLTRLYQCFATPVREAFDYMPGMSAQTPPYFALKLEKECGCQHHGLEKAGLEESSCAKEPEREGKREGQRQGQGGCC
ncbi:MAG: Coenzyme F420 hydrogenase/dehydrogenase, beta subunit C-terminal domain [Methanosarcinaceae archaeon]|nr:Coenzyme F420 hydrogenase/dehydrogenase, beta subunit C-terminal domain [Methanosarcinaceae archaeon]MDD4330807.1 Coenzyme F420 hydrogenase/dehydrogenase, beta subunit C-terminal domain [Methanosarcinaceae archaeon]MDD4749464.1 Coenzyme F420 hydrogenase/dehydrogenase, beta subunit C-terminal domain [Methanosarcinaceae archaeon]